MKQIFKIVYLAAFAFIFLIAALLLLSLFPIPGNLKIFVVQSASMEPAIKVGSLIVVKPVPDYKVGDVVTFRSFGQTKYPVSHRIVEVKKEGQGVYLLTKGDANNSADGTKIPASAVIGKTLFSIPYLGYAVNFAKKPAGLISLIIIPSVVIIADELKKILAEIKKLKSRKQAKLISDEG